MAHHVNPGRFSRRIPLSSAVPTTWRNRTGSAVTVRLIADVPFHIAIGRDHAPAEAAITDMLVPAMDAISVTVESGYHLSFRAYSSALVDGKPPRFLVQADGDYTIEPLPGPVEYRAGEVWVEVDGFVWASQVH